MILIIFKKIFHESEMLLFLYGNCISNSKMFFVNKVTSFTYVSRVNEFTGDQL